MLHEAVEDADDPSDADSIASALASLLAETIDDSEVDRVAAETGVDADIVTALADGRAAAMDPGTTAEDGSRSDTGDETQTTADAEKRPLAAITLEDAAAILALTDDRSADDITFEVRDHLLMGMTTAVLDVDAIAAKIDADLTGQEIQQAIEGRAAMSVAELAAIAAVIEDRKP